MGFEPTTLTLARLHSTTELFPHRYAQDIKVMKVFSKVVNPILLKKC